VRDDWQIQIMSITICLIILGAYTNIWFMETLCGSEARDLCWGLGQAKSYTQLATQVSTFFCIKESRSNFNGYRPYFNGFLRPKCWDFASMSGLGTPCELALRLQHTRHCNELVYRKVPPSLVLLWGTSHVVCDWSARRVPVATRTNHLVLL